MQCTLETQPVAHVVDADGVGELREKLRREMAANAEIAGLRFDSLTPVRVGRRASAEKG